MGGKNSGRKAKTFLRGKTEHTIAETSPHAAAYLREVAKGEEKKPNVVRVDVCKYIINQDLGIPRQKVIGTLEGSVTIRVEYGSSNAEQTDNSSPA